MTEGAGLEISVAGASDRAAWTDFVERSAGSEAGHRWEFHEIVHEVFRASIVRLVAREEGEWLGVLPLLFQSSFVGRFLTSVPYLNHAGVLGDDPRARRALAAEAGAIAARLGADRLELRGRYGEDLPIDTWSGKSGFTLELPDQGEILWERLGAKVRAQVKRPAKEGYEAAVISDGGRELFYPLFARKWHTLGSPVLPERFFLALEATFEAALDYVVVKKAGAVAAAGVLLHHHDRVEIPWAVSAPEDDRYGVNMALYWRAIERAIERNARTFDFGRSTPDTGNARFKLQWGAIETPLHWNVRLRDPRGSSAERGDARRGLVAATWKRLPQFVATRLGPVLAARIPY